MKITKEDIMYLRLYKQGLIKRFSSFKELINSIEIQAQSEKDMMFNINARLNSPVSLDEIYRNSIRNWYVRNTLFLLDKDKYEQVVCVNNIIDNWFNKKYLKDINSINDFEKIKTICQRYNEINTKQLLDFDINKHFVRNWGGAFIELAKQGVVYSKQKNTIFINKKQIKNNSSIVKVMKEYFKIYGPATLNDFKHWLGFSSKEINRTFNQLPNEYIRTDDNLVIYKNDLGLLKNKFKIPTIILGKFDNICLSYEDKTWLIGNQFKNKIWGPAGIVEAIIIINGKIIATWRQRKNGIKIKIIEELDDTQKNEILEYFFNLFGKDIKLEFVYEY